MKRKDGVPVKDERESQFLGSQGDTAAVGGGGGEFLISRASAAINRKRM